MGTNVYSIYQFIQFTKMETLFLEKVASFGIVNFLFLSIIFVLLWISKFGSNKKIKKNFDKFHPIIIIFFSIINLDMFILPWAYLKTGLVLGNIILVLTCCISFVWLRYSKDGERNRKIDIAANFVYLIPQIISISLTISLASKHFAYGVKAQTNTSIQDLTFVFILSIFLLIALTITNYIYSVIMDCAVQILLIGAAVLALYSSVSVKANFTNDLIWPKDFLSFMVGAIIIFQISLNLIVHKNRYEDKFSLDNKDRFLLISHAGMLVLYATVANSVFVSAGINTNEVVFQSFPDSESNYAFLYAFGIILYVNRYQSIVSHNVYLSDFNEKIFRHIFCLKNFIPLNKLLTYASIVFKNSCLILLSLLFSATGLKIGYLQALAASLFIIGNVIEKILRFIDNTSSKIVDLSIETYYKDKIHELNWKQKIKLFKSIVVSEKLIPYIILGAFALIAFVCVLYKMG